MIFEVSGAVNFSPATSALNNVVIVGNILRYCSYEDLKTLRLVSTKWNRLCLPILRKDSVVTVINDDTAIWNSLQAFAISQKPFWSRQHLTSLPLLEFLAYHLEAHNNCLKLPFRNFSLKWWQVDGKNEDINLFWNVCGRSITSLELYVCRFSTYNIFREFVLYNLQSLERLSLNSIIILKGFPKYDRNIDLNIIAEKGSGRLPKLAYLEVIGELFGRAPHNWKEIFFQCPNLKTLIIKNLNLQQTEAILLDLAAVRSFYKGDTLKITHLKILQDKDNNFLQGSLHISPSILRCFEKLNLPLESLSIELIIPESARNQLSLMHPRTVLSVRGRAPTREGNAFLRHDDFDDDDDDEAICSTELSCIFWLSFACIILIGILLNNIISMNATVRQ